MWAISLLLSRSRNSANTSKNGRYGFDEPGVGSVNPGYGVTVSVFLARFKEAARMRRTRLLAVDPCPG